MPSAIMTIFEEFLAVVPDFPKEPAPGQTRNEYIKKLAEAVYKVDEASWAKLTPPAQQWFNASIDGLNQMNNPPALPGFDVEGVLELTPSPSPVKAEPPAKKVKHTPSLPTAKSPLPPVKPYQQKLIRGISPAIRELVIQHPDWQKEQVKMELLAKGWPEDRINLQTISTLKADTLQTIDIIKGLGFWKE